MDILTASLLPSYPKLTQNNYKHTSPPTPNYNCIAWAARVDNKWWEPDAQYNYYWPIGVKREYTLEAYVAAYETVGFAVCDDSKPQSNIEKIAIYVHPVTKVPLHASRLLPDGKWTSKLGPHIDISHDNPGVLEGPSYGVVAQYMKRQSVALAVGP
jgi:hypothetical protein